MLALLCAATALALQPAPQVIKPNFKAGQEFRFQASAEMTFAGEKATVSTKYRVKIVEVRADGGFLIESVETESKARMGGQDMTMPPKNPGRTLYRADGMPLSLMGEGTDATGYRFAHLNAFRYPTGDVTPGSKWTAKVEAAKTGQVAGSGEYEYLGNEAVGAIECAKVRFAFKENEGAQPAEADGWFWISLEDGWIVKVIRNVKNAPVGNSPTPVSVSSTVERVQ
ncbi:MAG: hypothetical protein H3C58_11795 [Fimbriimonadaceae bacterium]|nr:hypothetical protein [Fimbriimonadaceae bacterium]